MPDHRLRTALVLCLALPLLVLYPLPWVWTSHLLAAPDQEAATHVWGLWAALHHASPLTIQTDLLAWPTGVELALIDPANLPAFALGSIFGPVAGYNTVLYVGVALAGLAGALLAVEVDGDPRIGATIGAACPTLLSNAADGMTEGFGVAWVGLQLAFLLRYLRTGQQRAGVAAALCLAAAAWSGPYNGVWAALVAGAVGVHALMDPTRRARAAYVGTAATLLVIPRGISLLRSRGAKLPGSTGRAGLPEILDRPEIFRGGVQTGADLLDPWLPGPLTGGEADISHTAYLGIVVIALAIWGGRRGMGRWLLGALAFALLSLGPWLYLAGVAPRVNGAPLLGPAGLATLAIPALGRMTRWYRAGAVATLLLAAPASRVGLRGPALVIGLVAVLADSLLLAPLAYPLHHTAPPASQPYAALVGDGAILEMPLTTSAEPPPGLWRDRTALAQTLHGRAVAGAMMLIPPSDAGRTAQSRIQGLMRDGRLSAHARAAIQRDGFRWLAVYPRWVHLPAHSRAALDACLGIPIVREDDVIIWALANGPSGDCAATAGIAPTE